MHDWLHTPAGQYLLAWEQAQFDRAVGDVFGFHALQLGMPGIQALQANRMPHRWLGLDAAPPPQSATSNVLLTHYEALPFPDHSLDLLVLPHTLEMSFDPHATLREAERVLVPEGRLVVCGFNPTSLWAVSHRWGKALPGVGDFIGHWRLRDWLRLLSFDVQSSQLGCYRPMVRSQHWLERFAWMDNVGPKWWPIFGAAYCVVAIKRVRGTRLLSPVWKRASARNAAAVTTVSKEME